MEPEDDPVFHRQNSLNPLVRLELIACENTLKEHRNEQETVHKKKIESWNFLASRGITNPQTINFDKPCDQVRKTLLKFMHSAVVFAQRLHRLIAAVQRIQRFFRKYRGVLQRRMEEVLRYWEGKEVEARGAMRDRIQRYKKAHPFASVVATNAPMWRDYMQCRVPRSLKIKTIYETMAARKAAWHQEWREHKKHQKKVQVLMEQERLLLSTKEGPHNTELQKVRAHREQILKAPPPQLRCDVASFSLMDLLLRALDLEEAAHESGYSYYAPAHCGEAGLQAAVARPDEEPDAGAADKAPPAMGRRPAEAKAKEVDWRRTPYDPGLPFAFSPKQRMALAARLHAEHQALGDADPKDVPANPRTVPFFYARNKPPHSAARSPPSPGGAGGGGAGAGTLEMEAVEDAAGAGEERVPTVENAAGAYSQAMTLAKELDLRKQKLKKQSDAKEFNKPHKRSLKCRHRPQAELEEELQAFTLEAFRAAAQQPPASAPPEVAATPSGSAKDASKRRDYQKGPAAGARGPGAAAAPASGRKQRILFQPMQHPGEYSEADLGIGTPRLSTSPSSPMYCTPGTGPSKAPLAGPQVAGGPAKAAGALLRRHGIERAYALALDASNFATPAQTSASTASDGPDALADLSPSPAVQPPVPAPGAGGSGGGGGCTESQSADESPAKASRPAPAIGDRHELGPQATNPKRLGPRAASTPLAGRRASSGASPSVAGSKSLRSRVAKDRMAVGRKRLSLWKAASQAPLAWPPTGGTVMSGLAAQTGVVTAASSQRRRKEGHDSLQPSHAAYLLAHLASRQKEVLKSLESDPIFSASV